MSASLGPTTSQSNKQFPLDADDPAAAKKNGHPVCPDGHQNN
jgi:hypothetical protein